MAELKIGPVPMTAEEFLDMVDEYIDGLVTQGIITKATAQEWGTSILSMVETRGVEAGRLLFEQRRKAIEENIIGLGQIRQRMAAKEAPLPPSDIDYESMIARTTGARRAGQEWEAGREKALGQLGQPRDWITKWFVEHTRKPSFEVAKPWGAKTPLERGKDVFGTPWGYPGGGEPGPFTKGMLAAGYTDIGEYKTARDLANEFGEGIAPGPTPISTEAETMSSFGGGEGSGGIGTRRWKRENLPPPAPEWLAGLVPRLVGGQPLKKVSRKQPELPVPSMQQWVALTPSQREMYRGYVEWGAKPIEKRGRTGKAWAGTTPEDIEAQMESMLPAGREPLRKRWAVRRQ